MKHYLLLLALLAAALVGCTDEPEIGAAENYSPIELSEPVKIVAAAQNNFGLQFFSKFNAKCGYDNYVISPYSVATNLTMLANGAEGNTRAEILEALGFDASQLADANELARVLMDRLPRMDKKSTMLLANSVWTSPGISLNSEFAQTMAKYFDAKAFNSSANEMGEKVNKWVASCTDDKITEVLQENALYSWIIANALYFNSSWEQQFDSDEKINFTNAYGRTSSVDGMKGDFSTPVFGGDNFDVVNLYYGNGAFVLKLIVPHKGTSLNTIIERYCNGTLDGVSRHMISFKLTIPIFSVDFCGDIRSAVESMGIRDLFRKSNCDMANMASGQHYVNVMRQGAKFNVNKDGSDFVAATVSGEMYILDASLYGSLIVDRPFAFIVEERSTGTILLAGKVTKL